MKKSQARYVICVRSGGTDDLEVRKLYRIVPDASAAAVRERHSHFYARKFMESVLHARPLRHLASYCSDEDAGPWPGVCCCWLEPKIELARSQGLEARDLGRIRRLVEKHEQEIRDAWNSHFGS